MIYYCHAQEEIPRECWQDFREWMAFKEYRSFHVPGVEDAVYHPYQVKEFKQMTGIRPSWVIEDIGELENKMEFAD